MRRRYVALRASLGVLSLVSWGVMLMKWLELRRVRAASRQFIREFEHAQSLEAAEAAANRAPVSPFTDVFRRALTFLAETRPALGPTSRHRNGTVLADRSAEPGIAGNH
jgi:biopolymer transport protein TolQ